MNGKGQEKEIGKDDLGKDQIIELLMLDMVYLSSQGAGAPII